MELPVEEIAPVVNRIKRARGQLDGVVRMLEEGRPCEEIVTQLAAASKALDRAGFAVIASGLRQCVAADDSELDLKRMERLFLSLAWPPPTTPERRSRSCRHCAHGCRPMRVGKRTASGWRCALSAARSGKVSMSRRRRSPLPIVSLFVVAAGYLMSISSPPAASAPPASAPPAPAPQLVPKPVSMTVGTGEFTLTRQTHIVTTPGSPSRAVAEDLAAYLRPATGYRLPVVSGPGRARDIRLELGDAPGLSLSQAAEGYVLDAGPDGVRLAAGTAHGLFNGIQTIRQLLPAWIESPTTARGPWTIPSVHIVDYPRYAYRGFMLDIARHFQTPAAVMSLIDQASAYKVNTLHLHVSDDQGFRIVINGFPNLTAIGSIGSVGTDGRTMDPGGFWTQQDYRNVVAYAAAHFMSVVPEVDSPGHNNAIIMSEYNDTANPLLNGDPQDINCSRNDPPQWNYTGAVGYSAMCPDSDNTWTILGAIIDQLTAMSP